MALLERMRTDAVGGRSDIARSHFERTHYWDLLERTVERRARGVRGLDSDLPSLARVTALERALSLLLAESHEATVLPQEVQEESERFRREHGLLTPEATSAWFRRRSLDLASFSAFIHDEVLVKRFRAQTLALTQEQLAALRTFAPNSE